MSTVMDQFAWLHGKPTVTASLKSMPEDFMVNEDLGFDFCGTGEHFMVKIRKVGENTKYVVNELAKACGVTSRQVSWAGLKDRHAVTEQWLSVHLPGKADPDLTEFVATHPGIEVLETTRHDKKLRPGDLKGNQFILRLRDVSDLAEAEKRFALIQEQGVPNYFGEQRFGHNGNNVVKARAWGNNEFRVRDKSKRSFYLSAARSWLFNLVVSARLDKGLLTTPLLGDCLAVPNRHDCTLVESIDDTLLADLHAGRCAITAPLVGDNALPTKADAEAFELSIIDQEPALLALIRDNRMRHERRTLVLKPEAMTWKIENNDIIVSFALPAGCFATSVMREVIVNDENKDGDHENIDQ